MAGEIRRGLRRVWVFKAEDFSRDDEYENSQVEGERGRAAMDRNLLFRNLEFCFVFLSFE